MNLLLDTHAYLWWLSDSAALGKRARATIADPETLVFVSAASIWEASVKSRLGRLDLKKDADLVAEIAGNEFEELAISARHARQAAALPPHHRDPFDRMLIAQATMEELRVVTRDPVFARYGVATLW